MSARLLHRIVRVSRRLALRFVFSRLDGLRPTFAAGSPEGELSALIGGSVKPREREAARISELACHYLGHRFDLLGSGWVNVRYGMVCNGVEGYRYAPAKLDFSPAARINKANLAEATRIGELIDRDYVPIDWQLDFKSGYRWSEKTGYRQIAFGHLPGVDIKVPWELARMQHLPQLALAYSLAGEHEKTPSRTACAKEYRNQVLDFIANNPPRYGVNWACTMDVAIRVANWLVAYDLFKAGGAGFDREFEAVFSRSVYEHGCHIIRNLEWSDEFRGNHYLADIAGLLFVSAYLPRSRETDAWLAFSIQQLISEVKAQFTPDGANFEASTSYHRLSAELVIFSTAVVLGLPEGKRKALTEYDCRLHKAKPALAPAPIALHSGGGNHTTPFPEWYFERLEKMAEFTMHITKPDGKIPQIGDNDSGYFFKFTPPFSRFVVSEARSRYANLANYQDLPDGAPYLMEEHLDHRQLVGAINALFKRSDLSAFSGESFTAEFVSRLAGGVWISSYHSTGETDAEQYRIGTNDLFRNFKPAFRSQSLMRVPLAGHNISEALNLFAYPDFGLYIFKSSRLYLALHCGPVGQNGNGGHAHSDQLAIELSINGENWISDPGTYLYTALPEKRNEYRSVGAHFAPRLPGKEPARLDLNVFRLEETTHAKCLYFGELGFIGTHEGYGLPVWRAVSIGENEIRVTDYYSHHTNFPERLEMSRDSLPEHPPVSPGYGIVCANTH